MQHLTQNGMLNFSQCAVSYERSYWNGGEWYAQQQSNSSHGSRKHSSRKLADNSQCKERRVMERSLNKVRKEWMKVKEEMGYAKLCGEHLSESLMETDKKIEVMLEELNRTDKYVQDLLAQNDHSYR